MSLRPTKYEYFLQFLEMFLMLSQFRAFAAMCSLLLAVFSAFNSGSNATDTSGGTQTKNTLPTLNFKTNLQTTKVRQVLQRSRIKLFDNEYVYVFERNSFSPSIFSAPYRF